MSPLTKYFLKSMHTNNGGSIASVENAHISSQGTFMNDTRFAIPTGTVTALTRDKARAKKYSFQENMKQSVAATTSPGVINGNVIRVRAPSLEQPSIARAVEDALAKYEKPDEAMEEIRKLDLDSHGKSKESDVTELRNGNRHNQRKNYRIVKGEGKLINSLNSEWDLVKELPEDKFILKKDYREV